MKKLSALLMVAAMVACFVACATASAGTVRLKLDSGMPIGHILTTCCDDIARKITDRSNGEIVVTYYPADSLGNAAERAAMLMEGDGDISQQALSVFDSYNPRQGVMSAFFMFESWEHYRRCTESQTYRDLIRELEKVIGATLIGDVYYAKRNFLSTKPIKSLADMKGMKFRVPNEAMPIAGITALGASPTPMPGSEVYTAIQNGTIQATENGAEQVVQQAFQEIAPHLTFTAHQYQTMVYLISDKAKAKLTEAQYKLVCDVIAEVTAEYTILSRKAEAEKEDFLRKTINCYEIDLTDFREACEAMYNQYDRAWGEGTWKAFKALR